MLGPAQALLLPEHVSFALSEAACPALASPLCPASFLEFGPESACLLCLVCLDVFFFLIIKLTHIHGYKICKNQTFRSV